MPAYLNFCHLLHDPSSPGPVARMCPSCHARHDARHSFAVRRRNLAKRVGQLWLWDEVEWAPWPAWLVPERVVRAGQGELFAP